ncbi:MAG: hypothetical protein RL660_2579 [Bacteroidota bacterium]|jgi:AraC-like DNA-binding protein
MLIEHKYLLLQNKIVFERLTMQAAFKRVPKIFREDEACFLYVTKGAFVFRTPQQILSFSEGDGMLAKCGNYFIENTSFNKNLETQTISVVGAFFYPEMIRQLFAQDHSKLQPQPHHDVSKLNVEPLLMSFIASIYHLLDNPEIADESLLTTKLKELIILLSKTSQSASILNFIAGLFAPHQYTFETTIANNLYSDLSLLELARLCNTSLASFKRKFQQHFNQPPAQYLLGQKLLKAQHMLATIQVDINSVAAECGFSSVSSLTRTFKKQFGCTPKQYQKSHFAQTLS